jgi:hypothetical protein
VVDARITQACCLLHPLMFIEDGTPLSVVPHLMTVPMTPLLLLRQPLGVSR